MCISVRLGFPSVSVPVLSNMTYLVFRKERSHCAFFAKIPFFAPCPTPVIIAIGVASPSPQGQAITRTPTKLITANSRAGISGKNVFPKKYQKSAERVAMIRTQGTKNLIMESAIF